jgi:hypothetical protein
LACAPFRPLWGWPSEFSRRICRPKVADFVPRVLTGVEKPLFDLLPAPCPQRPNAGNVFNNADNPFQEICTPMHTSKNDDNLMITLIAVGPNTWASRSENP